MITLRLDEIAAIVGGWLADATGAEVITGNVEFDSRKVASGDLFVALSGVKVDGHDYAAAAMDRGAAGVLAARPVGVPAVIVPPATEVDHHSYATEHDTDGSVAAVLEGMAKLARYVVDKLSARGLTVIGITGSAGKTSTKDIVHTILELAGDTVAPPGSFNNEIGHPYTALRCTEATKYLVSEMSARSIGNIAHLAAIAPPHIGVVLNVGTAHMGEFGSRDNIARAKGELVEALPADGIAVLNADDDYVAAMADRTSATVWSFSTLHKPVRVAATDIRLDNLSRPTFTLIGTDSQKVTHTAQVTLQIFGEHQVANALAAATAALAAGVDFATVAQGLRAHTVQSAHRMDVHHAGNDVIVIDDAYNANPESMRVGLRALALAAAKNGPGARSIAVLGPMAELGQDATADHVELMRTVAEQGIDLVVVVGTDENARAMINAAAAMGLRAIPTADTTQAATEVLKVLGRGDVILVKASNAYRLWQVAEAVVAQNGKQEN
ncbi:UDP-N-acetylmuramoyl-tripeptide--D-alanyl-D-alanine ligase [Corynebacterium matruchotii]|uniref:UDP-N-acetylmuramoyl-tripeptide--D-alanyl-D- alanine ligase n=1 Tax=Corynebacterium matruchotii TaxID=43768 RepID=UPI0024304F34|nr:UDP-N-acetylmuramoyl-tripeptide--D-alanyl-D-alanine ligase [Corynebacterium matruchotii]